MKKFTHLTFILAIMCMATMSFGQWANPGINPTTVDAEIQSSNPDIQFDCTSASGLSGLQFLTNGISDGYLYYDTDAADDGWGFGTSQGVTNPFFFVDDSWEIGVNTNNPLDQLHIIGSGTTADIRLEASSSKYLRFYEATALKGLVGHSGTDLFVENYETNGDIWLDTEAEIKFQFDGTTKTYFNNNGIGIGSLNTSGSTGLFVDGGDIEIRESFPFLYLNSTSASGNRGIIMEENGAAQSWIFHSPTADVLKLSNTTNGVADHLAIATNGEIGFGTDDPSDDLHISSASPFINLQSTTSGNRGLIFSNSSNVAEGYVYLNATNGNLTLWNTGSSDFVVDPSGNVGIGTSSPDRSLEVVGQVLVSNMTSYPAAKQSTFLMRHYDQATHFAYFKAQSSSTQNSVIFGGGAGANYAATSIAFHTGATTTTLNGTERMRVRSDGRVRVGSSSFSYDFNVDGSAGKPGGGDWSTLSDRRVKTGIRKFEDGLEQVLQINPVFFQYKEGIDRNNGKEYVGIIAQEMQEVAPYTIEELAVEYEEGDKRNIDMESVLAYDGTAVRYMLVNAVKELAAENEKLKEDNEKLKEDNETLNNRLDEIEKMLQAHAATLSSSAKNEKDVSFSGSDEAILSQNQPNPFNENTIIKYYLPEGTKNPKMVIFNEEGRLIKTISIDAAGEGQINLRANALPSGSYTYQLTSDNGIIGSKTMVLVQ